MAVATNIAVMTKSTVTHASLISSPEEMTAIGSTAVPAAIDVCFFASNPTKVAASVVAGRLTQKNKIQNPVINVFHGSLIP
jgi:hypothetical protein